jgi:hypothetical protein
MKRTLMTSVALSAMIAGAVVTAPALDAHYSSPAQAQDATTPPVEPGASPDAGADTGETSQETGPEGEMDGQVDPNADVDDGMIADPDAPPTTATGEDDPSAMSEEDEADAETEADEMLSDTEDSAAAGGAMTDGEMFVDMQAEDEVSANTYIGQDLYNMEEENIGTISDLIFSADGDVTTAVVGVGGFLGIGQKDVGVNFDMIEIQTEPDSEDVRLTIDATEETLTDAPEYVTLEDAAAESEAMQTEAPAGGAEAPAGGTEPMAPAPAPAPAQ